MIEAIDTHAHFGFSAGSASGLADEFMSGDAETVLRRARVAGTRLTVCSPLRARDCMACAPRSTWFTWRYSIRQNRTAAVKHEHPVVAIANRDR